MPMTEKGKKMMSEANKSLDPIVLQKRIAELEMALKEVRPLVIGANYSESRYPKARRALEVGKDE